MREISISDIHGCHDELVALLDLIGPLADDDLLIFLGDYFDRGPNSKQVLEAIQGLKNRYGCHRVKFLRGNHDDMLLDYLKFPSVVKYEDRIWEWGNGGYWTLESFEEPDALKRAACWIYNNTKLTFETKHAVYVHAGLFPGSETPEREIIWFRGLETLAPQPKRLIAGHTTIASMIHDGIVPLGTTAPYVNGEKNFVMIDNGVAYGKGPLCAYDVINNRAYYSDGTIREL